jgi:hypothetical protein
MIKVIFAAVILLGLIGPLRADQGENWYIGPRVGFVSPFTGLVGIEAQRKHFALSAGMPGTYGAKYYFSIPNHSWYVGLYMVRYNYTPESVQYSDHGYPYDTKKVRRNGVGGGYRWRWGSGWDLDLSVGVESVKDTAKYKGIETVRWSGTGIRGGPTFGYSF